MQFSLTRFHASAIIIALVAGGSSPIPASALDLSISDCAGLASLPTGEMTEDVNLRLEDGTVALTCDTVTTVHARGNYNFRVISNSFGITFTNVRFEVGDGAEFYFNLDVGDTIERHPKTFIAATFTGVEGFESNGGVLNVESGSSATFEVPVLFDSNSVQGPSSGGAVYTDGKVTFKYLTVFKRNQVISNASGIVGVGGGIAVGPDGEASFDDYSRFRRNSATGGQGGGMANSGKVVFKRASRFKHNVANGDGDDNGGHGGALFTENGSTTTFERRVKMSWNSARIGGALYNLGNTVLETKGYFRINEAYDGASIYTKGFVSAVGDLKIRYGTALNDGGAVYIDNGGLFAAESVWYLNNFAERFGGALYVENGGSHSPVVVRYHQNFADGRCNEVYARGQNPVCQP